MTADNKSNVRKRFSTDLKKNYSNAKKRLSNDRLVAASRRLSASIRLSAARLELKPVIRLSNLDSSSVLHFHHAVACGYFVFYIQFLSSVYSYVRGLSFLTFAVRWALSFFTLFLIWTFRALNSTNVGAFGLLLETLIFLVTSVDMLTSGFTNFAFSTALFVPLLSWKANSIYSTIIWMMMICVQNLGCFYLNFIDDPFNLSVCEGQKLFKHYDILVSVWMVLLVVFVLCRFHESRHNKDITKLRQSNSALSAAHEEAMWLAKLKQAFLSSMQLEIRAPLAACVDSLQQLQASKLDMDQTELVDAARAASAALRTLLADVLDISCLDSGLLVVDSVPFELHTAIEATVQLLAVRAQNKGLDIAWDIEDSLPEHVMGDPARLRQVLLNLVGNAVKFTSEGEVVIAAWPEITVGAQVKVHFTVSDTGMGIAEHKLQSIFDGFSRDGGGEQLHAEKVVMSADVRGGDSKARTPAAAVMDACDDEDMVENEDIEKGADVPEGNGLGLCISKRLAKAMDGDVWAQSSGIGRGSTFHFTAVFGIAPAQLDAPSCTDGTEGNESFGPSSIVSVQAAATAAAVATVAGLDDDAASTGANSQPGARATLSDHSSSNSGISTISSSTERTSDLSLSLMSTGSSVSSTILRAWCTEVKVFSPRSHSSSMEDTRPPAEGSGNDSSSFALHIIVLDPHELSRLVLARQLVSRGFDQSRVQSGFETVESLTSYCQSNCSMAGFKLLVFLDWRQEEQASVWAREFPAFSKHCYFVLLLTQSSGVKEIHGGGDDSSQGTGESKESSPSLRVTGHLHKPYTSEDLTCVLRPYSEACGFGNSRVEADEVKSSDDATSVNSSSVVDIDLKVPTERTYTSMSEKSSGASSPLSGGSSETQSKSAPGHDKRADDSTLTSSEPLHIIVFDRNPTDLSACSKMLKAMGHTVTPANSTDTIVSLIKGMYSSFGGRNGAAAPSGGRLHFDAIMMDLTSRHDVGIHAFDVTRTIRQCEQRGKKLRIPIVAVGTVRSQQSRSVRADMDSFVMKPFKEQELFAVMEDIQSFVKQGGAGSSNHGAVKRARSNF